MSYSQYLLISGSLWALLVGFLALTGILLFELFKLLKKAPEKTPDEQLEQLRIKWYRNGGIM